MITAHGRKMYHARKGIPMNKVWLWVVIIGVLAVVAGAVVLMSWDIPPPSEKIERTLPDDRFDN